MIQGAKPLASSQLMTPARTRLYIGAVDGLSLQRRAGKKKTCVDHGLTKAWGGFASPTGCDWKNLCGPLQHECRRSLHKENTREHEGEITQDHGLTKAWSGFASPSLHH